MSKNEKQSFSRPVYLDYAASTPLDPEVQLAMVSCMENASAQGNPSSTHFYGRQAMTLIEQARQQVAELLSAEPTEILFTSGATESNNMAIRGAALFYRQQRPDRRGHIITAKTEHKAVLEPIQALQKEGFEVTFLVPGDGARVSPQQLQAAIREDTVLVSLMQVNNETGVVQDVAAFADICRQQGVKYHLDGAQSPGRAPLSLQTVQADYVSLSGHKIYGPKGVGALYIRRQPRARLIPVLVGGGQESGLRPGTLATHQIVGMGQACQLIGINNPKDKMRISELRDTFWQQIKGLAGVRLNSELLTGSPVHLNVTFEGVDGVSLRTALPDVMASSGSACNSQVAEPSQVLKVLGLSDQQAESSMRFSFGRQTTLDEVLYAAKRVRDEVNRLRALSPVWPEKPVDRNVIWQGY